MTDPNKKPAVDEPFEDEMGGLQEIIPSKTTGMLIPEETEGTRKSIREINDSFFLETDKDRAGIEEDD